MTAPKPGDEFPERFRKKVAVDEETGCWNWTSGRTVQGYPRFYQGRPLPVVYAHRFAYSLMRGPLVPGMELDHLCRNRGCCNPDHLEQVSHAENVARGDSGRRTQCIRGHAYTAENTRMYRGKQQCRACQQFREERRDRHAEKARRAA